MNSKVEKCFLHDIIRLLLYTYYLALDNIRYLLINLIFQAKTAKKVPCDNLSRKFTNDKLIVSCTFYGTYQLKFS